MLANLDFSLCNKIKNIFNPNVKKKKIIKIRKKRKEKKKINVKKIQKRKTKKKRKRLQINFKHQLIKKKQMNCCLIKKMYHVKGKY